MAGRNGVFPTPVGMNRFFGRRGRGTHVFPTPVGMNRIGTGLVTWLACVPHACGDEPEI